MNKLKNILTLGRLGGTPTDVDINIRKTHAVKEAMANSDHTVVSVASPLLRC